MPSRHGSISMPGARVNPQGGGGGGQAGVGQGQPALSRQNANNSRVFSGGNNDHSIEHFEREASDPAL